MKLANITQKASIGIQLGSIAASVFLNGHNQEKNENITNKVLTIAELIKQLTNNNSQQ